MKPKPLFRTTSDLEIAEQTRKMANDLLHKPAKSVTTSRVLFGDAVTDENGKVIAVKPTRLFLREKNKYAGNKNAGTMSAKRRQKQLARKLALGDTSGLPRKERLKAVTADVVKQIAASYGTSTASRDELRDYLCMHWCERMRLSGAPPATRVVIRERMAALIEEHQGNAPSGADVAELTPTPDP